MEIIVVIAVLTLIAYLVQHGSTGSSLSPRMAGSVSFEDRDIARIEHDLVR